MIAETEKRWTKASLIGALRDGEFRNRIGVFKFLDFRKALESVGMNLRMASLRGANLCGASLSEADLCHADLEGADLSYARLQFANLRFANLKCARLAHAELCGADLFMANLDGADISSSDLTDVNMLKASLSRTKVDSVFTAKHNQDLVLSKDGRLPKGLMIKDVIYVIGPEGE